MGIRILILSRGRSGSIADKTCRVFPEWVEVLVPESELEEYRRKIPNPLLTVPDDVEGLGRLRNWVLDNFEDETVVMVDDDVNYFYRLTGPTTERVEDPEEVVQVVANAAVMAKDAGLHCFGFSQTDIRKFNATMPFCLTGWVGCLIGVIGRKFRFRDDKFKVDIDYCLQCMLVDRVIWIDARYWLSQSRDNNMGGNAKFRTQEEFERSLDSLVSKWGDALKVRSHKNQLNIRTNVKRRQVIQYE